MAHYDEQREKELDNTKQEHWLMNGDALKNMDLLIKRGVKVDSIITDPPFNIVEKIGKNIHLFRQSEQQKDASITRDNMSFDVGFNQMEWLERIPKLLKKGGNLIIFNDWENMGDIARALRKYKIKVKCLNHWQKNNPCPAEWGRRFVAGREYFLHCTNGGKYTFNTEKLHKGEFHYPLTKPSEKKAGKHPNQKPLNLMEELISILSNNNQTILDPFMGSGSTGVACKNLNRKFIGIELDENYFNIAKERIENA
jgi:DNA modification methylase